ncbi:MAG: TlpA family protein disulfide reductase [Verrucomicrobia bacterium]|nr:TlpA family protein disulfide reductase [Verrucomicrobiota bacterium]
MKRTSLLLAFLMAGYGLSAFAAGKLGDPAKPLTIKEWIQGKPVDVLDGKNVYVVEFWATWCGPCKTSIPHLSELQKKLKDKGVVIVGISDEAPSKVRPYVERMGEKMSYTVACDDNRKSFADYMGAYNQRGIPTAFVVGKDGKVIWVGHPLGGLDQVLEGILAGKYDLAAARAAELARAERAEYQRLSAAGDASARELGRKLLAKTGNDAQSLVDFAFAIVANTRNKNRDFELAEEALSKAEKAAGAKDHRILGTRSILLFESGKETEGLTLAREALALSTSESDQARYKNYVRVMEARIKK